MKGLSGFCECLELLQIFLGMWLRRDFQLSWQDQIKLKAFLLLWQAHMIKPPNCEIYWSRRCERATGSTDPEFIPPGDPGDSLIPVFQELHAESGSSQSSAGTSHGITPGFTTSSACATPGLALCIYRQSFPHGSTMEKAPAWKFQWEGFNPTSNTQFSTPGSLPHENHWPCAFCFTLSLIIEEKHIHCSRAAQRKRGNTCDMKGRTKFWRIIGVLVKFHLVCKLTEKYTN